MKLGSACLQCRQGKRKCEKPSPGSTCAQCQRRNLHCSSVNRSSPSAPAPLVSRSQTSTQAEESCLPLPPKETILNLIKPYVCYIHDKPHSIFHHPTLLDAAKNGTLSQSVLFAIFGLSARFSSEATVRSQGHVWAAIAKQMCQQSLEDVCIESIQTCILCGNICLAELDANTGPLYFVIANRMAQLLQLAKDDPTQDLITQEVKRRVWWSLFMIDIWSSAGIGVPRQIFADGLSPSTPMDEVAFTSLETGQEVESFAHQPGIWSHMITLVKIFSHIQDLNKALVDEPVWNEEIIETQVLNLAAKLDGFDRNLSPSMIFTKANLDLQVYRGVGRTFVAMHLGYHHYATLLYYQYHDQSRPLTPNTRLFTQRCKHHAKAYCELVELSVQHGNAEALHNVVGHMTVVSSSVHLHTLLLGDDEELPMARQHLEYNFEYLVRSRTIWPSVDQMMKRLIIFQDACLRNAQLGTHRFDKWIVKFLLQHALALDSMEYPGTHPDTSGQIVHVEHQRLLERSRVTESIIRASHTTT